MSLLSWLQNLRSALTLNQEQPQPRRRASRRAGMHRPHLKVLEDRLTLSLVSPYFSYQQPNVVLLPITVPQPPLVADFTSDGILDQINSDWSEVVVRPGRGDGTHAVKRMHSRTTR